MLIDPYRFGPQAWTPAQLTTALWLDASDSSTVTTVSGAVSQWNDKSGNGRNASQSTAANRPAYGTAALNGLNVIRCDATNDFMDLANTSGLTNATAFYFFGVRRSSLATVTNAFSSNAFIAGVSNTYGIGFDTSVAFTTETTMFLAGPDNATAGQSRRSGADSANYSRSSNAAEIYCVFATNTSASIIARVNGSQVASLLEAGGALRCDPSYSDPALTGFRIFGSGTAQSNSSVDFAEMLILTSVPTQANIERIEGYLAHKWGLTASLPAGHPYKSVAPTV